MIFPPPYSFRLGRTAPPAKIRIFSTNVQSYHHAKFHIRSACGSALNPVSLCVRGPWHGHLMEILGVGSFPFRFRANPITMPNFSVLDHLESDKTYFAIRQGFWLRP